MRLLHPNTLFTVAKEMKDEEFNKATVSRKQVVSHAWSEVLKYLATRQTHPKMFLDDTTLGIYMRLVHHYGTSIGCNLNESHLTKYDEVWISYLEYDDVDLAYDDLMFEFDNDYAFSDAASLYLKGLNIFPYMYYGEWRKYVPIESLKEIHRVVTKTLDK